MGQQGEASVQSPCALGQAWATAGCQASHLSEFSSVSLEALLWGSAWGVGFVVGRGCRLTPKLRLFLLSQSTDSSQRMPCEVARVATRAGDVACGTRLTWIWTPLGEQRQTVQPAGPGLPPVSTGTIPGRLPPNPALCPGCSLMQGCPSHLVPWCELRCQT